MEQIIFEDCSGRPVPRLYRNIDGTARDADGIRYFSPEQAASRWKMPADELERMHGDFFADLSAGSLPAEGGEPDAPWTRDEAALRLLWQTNYPRLSHDDFSMVVAQATRRGFSPWARMLYAERRPAGSGTELVIYATIEALRVIAHRSGDYVGIRKTEFVYGGDETPISASVKVKRYSRGKTRVFEGEVFWRDCYPGKGLGEFWDAKPHTMMSKCAEAAALRRAFPELLEGLYTREEVTPPPRRRERPADDDEPMRPVDDDTIDPDRPRTPMQFQLRLIDYGFGSPERRDHLAAMFEKQFARLHQTDLPGFYGAVLKVLRAHPALYGASLPMSG